MARTKRSPRVKNTWFRNVKTQNSRVVEHYATEEAKESGYHLGNRQACRGNVTGSIPDAYDDINVAAHWEMDHHA